MRPQYWPLVGTTPLVVRLENNATTFNVNIRISAGVTTELALEDQLTDPSSSVGNPGPTWVAAPAAVNGVITLVNPFRLVRFTPTAGGIAVILQQGIQ